MSKLTSKELRFLMNKFTKNKKLYNSSYDEFWYTFTGEFIDMIQSNDFPLTPSHCWDEMIIFQDCSEEQLITIIYFFMNFIDKYFGEE